MKLDLVVEPMKGLGGGFRSEWISAKGDGFEAGMDSGAGLGNACLTFWIKKKGEEKKYFTADMGDVFRAFVSSQFPEEAAR